MSKLAEFVALFTSLEDRVVELDRKDSQLAVELKSKESRCRFLVKENKELEDKRNKQIVELTAATKLAKDTQTEAEQKLTDIKNETARATQDSDQSKRVLGNKLDSLKVELDSVGGKITSGRRLVAELKQEKADLITEIEALNKQKSDKKAEVKRVEYSLAAVAADADEQKLVIKNDIAQANKELDELNDHILDAEQDIIAADERLEAAKTQLRSITIKALAPAKALDERAKALDVREASIAEQERQLQVRIITSRRRTAV